METKNTVTDDFCDLKFKVPMELASWSLSRGIRLDLNFTTEYYLSWKCLENKNMLGKKQTSPVWISDPLVL